MDTEKEKERSRANWREWYSKPENAESERKRVSAYQRKWRADNKEELRVRNSMFRHNLSREEVTALLDIKHCQACQVALVFGKVKGGLNIDHDHATGKVRGVLCRECNLSLGNLDDSPQRLRLLAEYLERNKQNG